MASEYLFNSLSELTKLKKDLENGVYGTSSGSSSGHSVTTRYNLLYLA